MVERQARATFGLVPPGSNGKGKPALRNPASSVFSAVPASRAQARLSPAGGTAALCDTGVAIPDSPPIPALSDAGGLFLGLLSLYIEMNPLPPSPSTWAP